MTKKKFSVTGMSCAACSAAVEKAVSRLDGVESAQVNLLANSMVCTYDELKTDPSAVIAAVEKAGFGAAEAAEAGQTFSGAKSKVEGGAERRVYSHPHAALGVGRVSGSADVCVYGPYDRPAASALPAWHAERGTRSLFYNFC